MAREAERQSVETEDAGSGAPGVRAQTARPAETPEAAPSEARPARPEEPASAPRPARRPAPFWRRNLGRLLLAAVVAAAVAGYFAWRAQPAATHYVTAPVTRGSIVQSVATTGTVNPVVTVQVGSYVSGIIREIRCDYNTEVKAGQLCAKIDPRPYELTVDQNKANLASAKAQLEKDRANLAYAKTIYDRDSRLFKEKLISPDTLDSDKSKYDQAKAQIALDQAAIQQRQAALDGAEVNLGYTDIVSPVDGIVISRNVDVGQTVAASFQTPTLFLIAKDLTKMQVDTNVSESDVGQAKAGQKATFTVEAYPNKVFRGTVTQVRQAPITVQNVVTYDVVVGVDNPDLELLPGMTANTRIITAERDDVLRVPLQAIRFTPGGFRQAVAAQSSGDGAQANAGKLAAGAGARVWVLRGGRPQAVPVTTGLRDNSYVEITAGGLKEGDRVVVNESGGSASGNDSAQQRRPPLRF
jgi:HlyD family secretion protein